MAVHFGFWVISLGLIAIGSLKSVSSDSAIAAGFLGIFLLVGGTIHKGNYRWSGVFGLIGVGVFMVELGNALSYVREDGVVVDNLLMPYGAMIIGMGVLFAICLTLLFIGHRLSAWVFRRYQSIA